ncbi:MAG: transcriptional regulator [Verrucomicrobia bacterium]|nr:transcriptional regulator [Verrucomicrobiota bacterium]MBI3868525.1 transcriptional regulator [Verrucomicrobiota bacterium]
MFMQLDRLIHEKGRLAILALLAASPQASYSEIRDNLGMTDGNVTSHLRTLHQAGYVAIIKSLEAGRPMTSYSLTRLGRSAFTDYLKALERALLRAKQSLE